MPNTDPETQARIREAIARNEYAHRVIAGFRSAMPTLDHVWDYLEAALDDVLILEARLNRDCSAPVEAARGETS